MDPCIVNGARFISHLIYADDILNFSKANPKSLSNIKHILESFSSFSGMEVNLQKSSAYYSKAVAGMQHIQEIMGLPRKPLSLEKGKLLANVIS